MRALSQESVQPWAHRGRETNGGKACELEISLTSAKPSASDHMRGLAAIQSIGSARMAQLWLGIVARPSGAGSSRRYATAIQRNGASSLSRSIGRTTRKSSQPMEVTDGCYCDIAPFHHFQIGRPFRTRQWR